MQNAYLSGLGLGLSLIVAIGAQNAFLLRQGLRREHVFLMSLTCALSDALLIALGVTSLARITALLPAVEPGLRYGGAAFLMLYGARHAYAALKSESGLTAADTPATPLATSLATCLALTFLNPHVYLDTVLLIGSVSSRYGEYRNAFGLGAVTGSFLFFFSLGYGARLLAPVFARPLAWRCLDAIIAVVMVWIGFGLIRA